MSTGTSSVRCVVLTTCDPACKLQTKKTNNKSNNTVMMMMMMMMVVMVVIIRIVMPIKIH